jgi:glycosyltransferase involved in cell wall biosynthesis
MLPDAEKSLVYGLCKPETFYKLPDIQPVNDIPQNTANVSLVAANYNNGAYLRDFIESILASTLLPAEVIIVDDGSDDNSPQILGQYLHHPLFKIIFSEKNEGFANALNRGIGMAAGDYILRADPDDLLMPSKIEKQLSFLNQNPDIAGVGCNVEYFHWETGWVLNKSNFPKSSKVIEKTYRRGEHGLQHPTVMIRAEVFKKYPYRQQWVPAEDYDLFARMSADGYCFANISEALYRMRIHLKSASGRLGFDTIRKTYLLRREIFGIKTSAAWQWLYYFHIFCYRRYLLEKNRFLKAGFLFLSFLCYPQKMLLRMGFKE